MCQSRQVLVQSVKRTPTKDAQEDYQRSKRKRLKQEALLASSVAARELRAVVGLASRRGLNAEEVFQHFVFDDGAGTDPGGRETGRRRAGQKEIIQGMKGLGIFLSEEATTLLIEMIVRSRAMPPSRLPTRPTADASQLCGEQGRPFGARKESGEAATTGGVQNMVTRTERGPSKNTSAAGLKSSSSPPCQHISAEDLWNFAVAKNSEGVTSPNGREEKDTIIGSDERLVESNEKFEELAMKGSDLSVHWKSGLTSKRRRTADGSGRAKRTTGKKAFKDELPGMGRTGRPSPLEEHFIPGGATGRSEPTTGHPPSLENTQHSLGNYQPSVSTMSPMFASSDASVFARAEATSVRRTGQNEAAEQDVPRPHSMPNHATSLHFRDERDLRKSGDSLCTLKRKAFPIRAGLTVLEQDQVRESVAARHISLGKAEVVSFPCDNPSAEALDGRDRVFHVDRCGKIHGDKCPCYEG